MDLLSVFEGKARTKGFTGGGATWLQKNATLRVHRVITTEIPLFTMIHSFRGTMPSLDETNFIASSADVIGDVSLGAYTSIWYNATVRGDIHWIRIGRESNIQDNAVIHVTSGTGPASIGDRVTIGHSAVVHACTVENNVLIGMGAIVLDNAVIGRDSVVGAGALITARTVIPPRSMVIGSPAKVIRSLTDEEVTGIGKYADNYLKNSAIYREELEKGLG
jgi:carbonic anhydrase/acetyltransferase-like protein (isoleucine patch superfamily)